VGTRLLFDRARPAVRTAMSTAEPVSGDMARLDEDLKRMSFLLNSDPLGEHRRSLFVESHESHAGVPERECTDPLAGESEQSVGDRWSN